SRIRSPRPVAAQEGGRPTTMRRGPAYPLWASILRLLIARRADRRLRRLITAEDDHEVRHEIAALGLTEPNDPTSLDLLDRRLDHAHRTLADELTSGDDGGGLLPLEHGTGDLRGIGQLCDAGFDDRHTCGRDAGGDFVGELRRDLIGIVAQGHPTRVGGVVGIGVRDVPDCGLGLDGHEFLEVVDFEHRLCGVLDPPDDDGADLDRIAVEIVDFQRRGLMVADAGGDLVLRVERVDEPQPRLPDGADVLSVQLEDDGMSRRYRGAAHEEEHRGDAAQDAENDEDDPDRRRRDRHDQTDDPEQRGQQEQDDGSADREIAGYAAGGALPHTLTFG